MKRIILIFLVLLVALVSKGCITSANVVYTPLKGKYLEEPYVLVSDRSYTEVWDSVIDVLAEKGFPIKLLDKENGLVVCERSSLILNYTFEDKNGKVENMDAFVVLPNISNGTFSRILPTELSGVANIRIRKIGVSKTRINVNLNNFDILTDASFGESTKFWHAIRSTGLFEYRVAELIK
jgi:hypothetical protein